MRKLWNANVSTWITLGKEGDGLSIADLNKECEAVDIDEVGAREQTFEQDLKELRGRLSQAAERRTQARSAFDAVGGDDLAADAAAGRQAALSSCVRWPSSCVCGPPPPCWNGQ